ncbi:hypothetical protein ACJJTC_011258 [Scirpophaga incertulas]
MSKRKAVVNDIIYELSSEDIEISSDEEVKDAKIQRPNVEINRNLVETCTKTECSLHDIVTVDISETEVEFTLACSDKHNGGKTSDTTLPASTLVSNSASSLNISESENSSDNIKKIPKSCSKSIIFNEDIIIDSPASNSDLGVVGCENRTPLVTVRFRDRKLASSYKQKVKTFMLKLIKIHDVKNSSDLSSETDIELDIWPEDITDDDDLFISENENNEPDDLFFIDTAPCSNSADEVPTYKQASALISNIPEKEPSPPPVVRRGPICFNCGGPHQLRECMLPKNNARIAENRKKVTTRVGRYHVEDEQKYGHLIPGRISGRLRNALGLMRHEIPLYIYRMRQLGYPPGWLEEARISHSGITMFDSTGAAILGPEDDEGELVEPGSKDKFDIKKILDFPGFNVPVSSRYKEEGHIYGLPPMSEQDSKITMLQMLAPNAMKAYKRKKLILFPSSENTTTSHEIAEMDIDSGDEMAEFPLVPPLPDEVPPSAPPPPPPPPGSPPPSITDVKSQETTSEDSIGEPELSDIEKLKDIPPPNSESENVMDIPLPKYEQVIIRDVNPSLSSNRKSPSLDELEEKKMLLLNALNDVNTESEAIISTEEMQSTTIQNIEPKLVSSENIADSNDNSKTEQSSYDKEDLESPKLKGTCEMSEEKVTSNVNISTPENRAGYVKNTSFGTPVMNIASSYVKLPSDDKFAKDICDIINFENLPNSTGKYKQICNLLKKVKSEVDRIQES